MFRIFKSKKPASAAPTGREESAAGFLHSLGIKPSGEGWTFTVHLSSVSVENWIYRRNQLKPQDLLVKLLVPSHGLWRAQAETRDRVFCTQWRDNGVIVDSQQIKYTRLTRWPEMKTLSDFPGMVSGISKALQIPILRHANIGGEGIDVLDESFDRSRLAQWLAPCADTLGIYMSTTPISDAELT